MVNVPLYIRYGKVAQVKDSTQRSNEYIFNGGTTVIDYVLILRVVRKAVEFMQDNDPADAYLEQTANYLLYLSGRRNVAPAPPPAPFVLVQQPVNQVTNVGGSAQFVVGAIGGILPYSYQWYFNFVPISGADEQILSISNAQISDEGSYYCVVTDNNGLGQSLTSSNAYLIVTANLVAVFASAQVGDPWPTISGGSDPFSYGYTQNIASGANISWALDGSDNVKYFIFKEPAAQPVKTTWYNSEFNSGTIPDQVMRAPVVFGGFRYYVTRDTFVYDSLQPVILST